MPNNPEEPFNWSEQEIADDNDSLAAIIIERAPNMQTKIEALFLDPCVSNRIRNDTLSFIFDRIEESDGEGLIEFISPWEATTPTKFDVLQPARFDANERPSTKRPNLMARLCVALYNNSKGEALPNWMMRGKLN